MSNYGSLAIKKFVIGREGLKPYPYMLKRFSEYPLWGYGV